MCVCVCGGVSVCSVCVCGGGGGINVHCVSDLLRMNRLNIGSGMY